MKSLYGIEELRELIRSHKSAEESTDQIMRQLDVVEFENFGAWCLEDIRELPNVDPELSDEDARYIADKIEDNFDSDRGINNNVIMEAYEHFCEVGKLDE